MFYVKSRLRNVNYLKQAKAAQHGSILIDAVIRSTESRKPPSLGFSFLFPRSKDWILWRCLTAYANETLETVHINPGLSLFNVCHQI